MSDVKALIMEAQQTQGYSEGDMRSLVRSLADALKNAEVAKSDLFHEAVIYKNRLRERRDERDELQSRIDAAQDWNRLARSVLHVQLERILKGESR